MIAIQLNNLGLYTFNNVISQVPAGAMTAALNVVIDRPGVVETRRGLQQYGSLLSTPIYKMFAFQNKLIANHASKLAYDSNGLGAWVDYGGTFVAIAGDKIRAIEANQNLYFTTNNGIYKIDLITNNPYQAGGVPALDLTLAIDGVTGFLNNASEAAYRITWTYTDANGNLIEGNPSMSTTISNNSGNATNVDVTFTIPAVVTTNYTYRVYRTPQTGSLSISPGDTFQLAYQGQPTAGQITAKQVTITDVTPDILLGTTLYTSPGAQGEFQTNNPPPLAHDMCQFLGMMFYANCSTIQQFYINLISVGAPNGIQINDTISLVGTSTYVYTGKASNNFAAEQFKVDTSGTVAANIDATARNIVAAINQDPANTEFYAYYVSGFSQLPGQILIQARNLSHVIFYGLSSRTGTPGPFSPVLPTSGTTYPSSNNTVLNGIYVSKLNQPEAVPLVNLIFVGSGDQAIFRVYALRDAVIVEAQGGVYRITGTSPSTLVVTPFDNTVIQFGIDTGVTLNNSVYSNTTQGIISVTESGSQIMSRNVEGDILELAAPSIFTNFLSTAFAISYESDRKYIYCISSKATDITSTIQYIYNWITQSWTTWNLNITSGIVNPFDNLLYLAGNDGQVLQERKSFTLTDYIDRQWSVTISSVNGKVITLNDVSNAVVGYSLAQHVSPGSVELSSIITAVDTVHVTVTVTDTLSWYVGSAALICQPINSTITYAPLTCNYPNFLKRFEPVMQFIFSQSNFQSALIGFTTDLYSSTEMVTVIPRQQGGWGTFPWGTLPWGVTNVPLQMINTYLTKNTTIGHWLNMSVSMDQSFQNIALNGASGFYDIMGERMR
jgi:hypothetical protein